MIRVLFSFILLIIFSVVGVGIYFYSLVADDVKKIVEYKPELTTQIFDRNDELIANIFNVENRLYAKIDEIPGRIVEALVAIEDTSFFEHKGINFEAIFRAMIKNAKAMQFVEGASTLTQQLVKNLALSPEKKLDRKIKEAILSFKIEDELSKEEIIERYLNAVYFGHGYYGIKTAAFGYFHKNLEDLSLKEICMLVGMPRAPSEYDPTKHLDLSLSRGNRVVSRLFELGWINDIEYNEAVKEIPQIFDETLTMNKSPYVVDEVIKELNKLKLPYKTAGFAIRTTIDLKTQMMAQDALKFGYDEILKRDKKADPDNINGAIVVTHPQNGDILALVGGVDYKKSSFNRATMSLRQPGSSFKPFIYQIALDNGYSPMTQIPDIQQKFDTTIKNKNETWQPKNYGDKYKGYISMKQALKESRNLATINMMNDIGMQTVAKKLELMGFSGIPHNLSIALGSFGISPLNFSKFYSMFPNFGKVVTPRLISNIENRDGNITNYEIEKYIVERPEQIYLMQNMLKAVVESGTGTRARVKDIEICGKTGTSNDSIDAWFVGFTPEIQVVIWYGNDNNLPMHKLEGGSRTAAPVFREFLTKYITTYPNTQREFFVPSGVFTAIYEGKKEFFTEISPLPTIRVEDGYGLNEGDILPENIEKNLVKDDEKDD